MRLSDRTGRSAFAESSCRSKVDFAVRQCRLNSLHPCGRNIGTPQVQRSELGQPFEMYEPTVSHLGVEEIQRRQVRQPFEMLQPGIGHLRVVEIQCGSHPRAFDNRHEVLAGGSFVGTVPQPVVKGWEGHGGMYRGRQRFRGLPNNMSRASWVASPAPLAALRPAGQFVRRSSCQLVLARARLAPPCRRQQRDSLCSLCRSRTMPTFVYSFARNTMT